MTKRHTMLGFSLVISYLIVASVIIMTIATEQQPSHAQVKQSLSTPMLQEFVVPSGSYPHNVAPAPDGTVWYTAQGSGQLGRLDPSTGKTHNISLGQGSAPHGVIVGPDGAPWITDGGLNAIARVDPVTEKVRLFRLPENNSNANLNTATFDHSGVMWFTGQSGIYGRLDPAVGKVEVFKAPGGPGPYGITTRAPDGSIYYASLAGNHIAHIDLKTLNATMIQPPTENQGSGPLSLSSLPIYISADLYQIYER